MSIWSDIATWRGPTVNRTAGGMYEYRGVVLHIAEGSYEGTISWQRNPTAEVSSHFIVAKDGRIAQMVDTADRAWTQSNGNGHWLSIEHEGFHGQALTSQQIEADARIYARAVREYGIPLQSTDSTTGRGLGYHAMGGAAWGGHYDCPGPPIIAQRAQILARAQQILSGEGNKMAFMDDTDAANLAWRVEALIAGRQAVLDGNKKGEVVELVRTLDTLAWRMDGLVFGLETVRGGPTEGEEMAIIRTINDIAEKVAAIAAQPPGSVVIDDAQLERVLRRVIGSVDGASPAG